MQWVVRGWMDSQLLKEKKGGKPFWGIRLQKKRCASSISYCKALLNKPYTRGYHTTKPIPKQLKPEARAP
jgi:hypothetical protein